jgi:hypothetical protein
VAELVWLWPRLQASGDQRRWTVGAVLACRVLAMLLGLAAVPVELMGWHASTGVLLCAALSVWGAGEQAWRWDDRLARRRSG